jgi:hypothetical protein
VPLPPWDGQGSWEGTPQCRRRACPIGRSPRTSKGGIGPLALGEQAEHTGGSKSAGGPQEDVAPAGRVSTVTLLTHSRPSLDRAPPAPQATAGAGIANPEWVATQGHSCARESTCLRMKRYEGMLHAHSHRTAGYFARQLAAMWGKSGDLQRREGLRGKERGTR